uniref:Uncharacterized protein n=1 Tax=Anguilla anguilla TaxID=7936 RepID=A0A0E9XB53_ANGAN
MAPWHIYRYSGPIHAHLTVFNPLFHSSFHSPCWISWLHYGQSPRQTYRSAYALPTLFQSGSKLCTITAVPIYVC